MRESLLNRYQEDLPRKKFLCFGDYRIGKSHFLQQFSNTAESDFDDGSHFCKVFVKQICQPRSNQRIGIQLYELPSTSNPIYNSCYMENDYDGIIYFFEMTNSNISSELADFLRTYSQINGVDVWSIPVLLVGLKKQNICDQKFEQYKSKVLGKFTNVFPQSSIVFFGGDPSDSQSILELQLLNSFVETIAFANKKCRTISGKYHILNTMQAYWLLYTTRELLGKAISAATNKCWSYMEKYKFFLNL